MWAFVTDFYLHLNTMFSRFVNVAAHIRTASLFMAEKHSIVWLGHLIHSSVDRHLDCCHLVAIMNTGAMNIHLQVFV